MAACGTHHANRLLMGLPTQSRADWIEASAIRYPGTAGASPDRSAWTGGHGTEPYEQNTQQSPSFGRSLAAQPVQL
jgi:hypothetical protein